MISEATWEEAAAYAERVPAKYLECRVRRRHSWRPRFVHPDSSGYIDINERCTDCRSTCHYTLNARGVIVVPRKITYSEGYKNSGADGGRIVGESLGALRLEWITRKLPKLGSDPTEDD